MQGQATVGIPVCNEIEFIKDTLDSVIAQADQIVISDNASTDGTSELCRGYAQQHANIKYFRYEHRQSVTCNFLNCLNLSETEYFMWMGGHDLLSKNYVESLKKILEEQSVVLAYSNSVHLTKDHVFCSHYEYKFSSNLASENPSVRVMSTIRDISDCTLYYGLYKREVLQEVCESLSTMKLNGIDHAFLTQVAVLGRMVCSNDVTFYRIEPRQQEATCFDSWTRTLKSLYAENYDPHVHIPELIPIGIGYNQFSIAQSVKQFAGNPHKFVLDVSATLLSRWGVNTLAKLGLLYVFSILSPNWLINLKYQFNKFMHCSEYKKIRRIINIS